MSSEARKIMPQINKSLARMVVDSFEETCGFWTHLNFWTFSGLADQSQFSMWLHQSSCEHSTLDVWTCLASGSESSGPSQTTGCHRSLGTEELEENLFSACKRKTSAREKDIYYLPILENESNADRLLSRNGPVWKLNYLYLKEEAVGSSRPYHLIIIVYSHLVFNKWWYSVKYNIRKFILYNSFLFI